MRKTAPILILAALLLPSCALRKGPPDPAKIREKLQANRDGEIALVQSTVADPARAEVVVDLLAERDRLVAELAENVARHRERMATLNADYSTDRAGFDSALADYNKARTATQREFVELLAAMKNEVTAEEWKVIARYQLKKLDPRELAYGPAAGGS